MQDFRHPIINLMAPKVLKGVFIYTAILSLGLGACSREISPATGRSFLTPLSASAEADYGREADPKITAQYGGEYTENPSLTRYVDSIGQRLAANGERKDISYRFKILDTAEFNAFAIPGGYVYISRGILELANNEAELASVLGHEIGHVTARHIAEKMGEQQRARIFTMGAAIIGGALGGGAGAQLFGDLAGMGSRYALAGYSQDQEFEADSLGIRYMSRTNYDTQASADFLSILRNALQLEAKVDGKDPSKVDEHDMLASHPRTLDRVKRAIAAAHQDNANSITARDEYLSQIDGLLFGDNPDQGLIEGQRFIHPALHFTFEVPTGFKLQNNPESVYARKGDVFMKFYMDAEGFSGPLSDYFSKRWTKDPFAFVKTRSIDGIESATTVIADKYETTEGEPVTLRLFVIRDKEDRIYRFIFYTPRDYFWFADDLFHDTALSFRNMDDVEAAKYKPLRIHIVTVGNNDTVATLSGRMDTPEEKEGWFRVLNNLGPDERLMPGRKVKIITY